MEWQPIETAPKDREWILVCQSKNGIIRTARWCETWEHWETGSGAMSYIASVTHWMPLPPAPETEQ